MKTKSIKRAKTQTISINQETTEIVNMVTDITKKSVDLLLADPEIKLYFSLLDFSSEFQKHSINMAYYLGDMFRKLGYSEKTVIQMETAGLLHDIGKSKQKELFFYKGVFNAEQNELKKRHPRDSFDLLKNFSDPDLKKIVVQHHEYSNDPYPRDPCSETIDYSARNFDGRIILQGLFLAAADHIETCMHPRSYASKDFHLREVKLYSGFSDPLLLDRFVSYFS